MKLREEENLKHVRAPKKISANEIDQYMLRQQQLEQGRFEQRQAAQKKKDLTLP